MKPADRDRALVGIAELAEELRADLGQARLALRHRTQAQARIRAADPNGGGGGAGGPSDSTGGSVADAENTKVDAQLERWDMWVDDAYHFLSKLRVEVNSVLRPPDEPAPTQRRMNGCESCARDRVTRPNGERYFEPVAFGRYSKYCRPCGEYYGAERELPPLGAVVWMHQFGKTWTSKVLADAKRAANNAHRKSA